jgi:hypothetical protein
MKVGQAQVPPHRSKVDLPRPKPQLLIHCQIESGSSTSFQLYPQALRFSERRHAASKNSAK